MEGTLILGVLVATFVFVAGIVVGETVKEARFVKTCAVESKYEARYDNYTIECKVKTK